MPTIIILHKIKNIHMLGEQKKENRDKLIIINMLQFVARLK